MYKRQNLPHGDNDHQYTQVRNTYTKKLGCTAKISIQEVIEFHSFKLQVDETKVILI
jgi:hypothetical protein